MNVLLIEDSQQEATLLQKALSDIEGISIRVEHADRLSTACSRLGLGGIDAILLDLSLPDSAGLGTLARVQEQAAALPIVILTGMADERLAMLGLHRGAQDYLFKGQYDGAVVYRSLCYALERKRLFANLEERVAERTAELAVANQALQRDIGMRKQAEETLLQRSRQQQVIAQFGQFASRERGLQALMDEAVHRIAQTLEANYCKLLELRPDGTALLLRAGVGWHDGLVGQATVRAGTDTQAGYTLGSCEPVFVEDLRTEQRFSGPPLLFDHGVVSGLSVIVQGGLDPWGVLGVHTTTRRTFTQDDVNFVQAMAHILGSMIERNGAEEAMRESEARLHSIMVNSPWPGFFKALDGRYLYANSKFERLFQLSAGHIIGKTDYDVFSPEQADQFAMNDRRVLQGGHAIETEETAGYQDGIHTSLVLKFPLRSADGSVCGVGGIVTDITARKRAEEEITRLNADLERRVAERTAELAAANQALQREIATRKEAEEELRESEQQFHTMADTEPVLIWMSGPDKLCTYFNKSWLDYTGRTREQELGNGWADGVHPEDLDRCLKTYGEAFERREPFQMEYRLRKADGTYGWILDRAVPRLLQNGAFIGYIGSCIDLSERKDLEDRLRKAVKEKESLLREVHHRVKNNLQVISSLLNLQAASIKDPQVVQLFRESQTRITSIALLHETLHRSNDLSCIRMSNYLRTLAGHVFRSYGIDPNAVVLDLLVEDLAFDIDTAMTCGMIVEELLSNSLKHAYAGRKEGRIQIELRAQDKGAYLLQVSDDGVGISKDGVRRNPGSLGLELVNLLAGKLDGAVELQRGPGTAWRIEFHKLHYQERM